MSDSPSPRNLVYLLMGSDSDWTEMSPACDLLDEFGVRHHVVVTSAHRSPERTIKTVREAEAAGAQVIICSAGYAAHLAGVVAAHTTLPVVGVPLPSSPLQGLDALLSTVMMPGGVPVASMGLGKHGARNAALFALQVIALSDPSLRQRLADYKERMADDVETRDRRLQESRGKG